MSKEEVKPAKNIREYLKESIESFGLVRWIFREFFERRFKLLAVLMLLLSVADMAVGYAISWFTGRMVDGVATHDVGLIWTYAVVSALIIIVSLLIAIWDNRTSLRFDAGYGTLVTEKISRKFFEKSLGQHLREGTSLSVGNVEKSYGSVIETVELTVFNAVRTVAQIVAAFLLMTWMSPRMSVALLVIALLFTVYSLFLSQKGNVARDLVDEKRRLADRYRNDRWNMIERCKNNGRDTDEVESISIMSRDYNELFLSTWLKLDKLWIVRNTFLDYASLMIIGMGLYQVWLGEMTIGVMLPVVTWSRGFITGLQQFSFVERRLHKVLPSVKSLRKTLFEEQPDIVDGPDAVVYPYDRLPEIELDNVCYSYDKESQESGDDDEPKESAEGQPTSILRNVSLKIGAGEKVAIIGASGAGKTTISRLLLRYFDPTSGSVKVNGRDLRDYRHASWIAALGHIAQQPQVFDGTVRENLVYGLPPEQRVGISDDELWTVMRRLKIDFGSRLDKGLDTKVGRNGLKLSGGEAQRLLIGAAVIRKPRLMIIDEATSSLDSSTEKEVQVGLEEALNEGVTAVVIAHRLSTVRHMCNKFIVLKPIDGLKDGESQIESVAGSFEELYTVSPTFRELADNQGMSLCDLPLAAE